MEYMLQNIRNQGMSQLLATSNKQYPDTDKQIYLQFKSTKKRVLPCKSRSSKSTKSDFYGSFHITQHENGENEYDDYMQSEKNYSINDAIDVAMDYGKIGKCQNIREPFSNLGNNYEQRGVSRTRNNVIGFQFRTSYLSNESSTPRDENQKLQTLHNYNREFSQQNIRKDSQNSQQLYNNYKVEKDSLNKTGDYKIYSAETYDTKPYSSTCGSGEFAYTHVRNKSEGYNLNAAVNSSNISGELPIVEEIVYNFSKNRRIKGHSHSLSINQAIQHLQSPNKTLKIDEFQLGFCQSQDIFGKTYSARHIETGMVLCIKQITKKKVKYDLQKLIECLKIQSFCSHEHIIQIYGFIVEKQKVYILMEYHDEGGLLLRLKSEQKVVPKDTLEYLKHIALAINYLHANGLAYRNLKPQNFSFLYDTCKISNFSWCSRLDKQKANSTGIIEYSSPELLIGGKYTKECDIWGLGVVLYQMIFGTTPCHTLSRKRAITKILESQIQFPKEIDPYISQLLKKMLQKIPSIRIKISQLLTQIEYIQSHIN